PKNETTTWMDSCAIKVDLTGAVVASMGTSSAGQGHETLVATAVGEILERDPDTIRGVHSDSLTALPSNSPLGSRMAIMLAGAAAAAAEKIKAAVIKIGAHNLGVAAAAVFYCDGEVVLRGDPARRITWDQIVEIAHRRFHQLPSGMEPGLQA